MNVPVLHAVILTKNEEMHISRCIRSLGGQCDSITVVDSGSTDRTVELARDNGAEVLFNSWINYSSQMNFAINSLVDRGGWILRIDADEVIDADSKETLLAAVSHAPNIVNGILVQRRIHFLGRRIRHGAIEPSWQLRLFRNGRGRCEQRWMDEHIIVEGQIQKSSIVLSDINLNSISWWTEKHNTYASREAIDSIIGSSNTDEFSSTQNSLNRQAMFRRFLKERFYLSMPSGFRAFAYFLYRYVFRFGFLDGKAGFYFHFLQGFWYRILVDAKIREIRDYSLSQGTSTIDAIRARTGIDPHV
jgi:glycosyltransferase involved in cell wall biosynthesis